MKALFKCQDCKRVVEIKGDIDLLDDPRAFCEECGYRSMRLKAWNFTDENESKRYSRRGRRLAI